MAGTTKKKKAAALEVPTVAGKMEVKTLVAASPEELEADLKNLLLNFDLYEVQHNTVNSGGKVQFIAFVYGRPRA